MATNTALNNMLGLCTVTDKDTTNHVLNAGSSFYQQYTNTMFSSGDTVQMPVTSTLMLGRAYTIFNSDPFFTLPVNSSGGNLLITIPENSFATFMCVDLTVTDETGWMVQPASPPQRSGSSTPTITFTTPGNLTVSYSSAYANYYTVANFIYLEVFLRFTPTYTSASGTFTITNLPTGMGSQWDSVGGGGILVSNGWAPLGIGAFAYPASCTVVSPNIQSNFGTPIITLQGMGSSTANTSLTTTQFPTATARWMKMQFTTYTNNQ